MKIKNKFNPLQEYDEARFTDFNDAIIYSRQFKRLYGYKPGIFKETNPVNHKWNFVIVKPRRII